MRKLLSILMAVLVLSILASCNGGEEQGSNLPEIIKVDLSVQPEKGEVNQPISFEAKVTQGNEQVNDAEVIFEIWRAKDENHEKTEIKKADQGKYRLEKTFQQEGTYYIISHVTARDMHNMPKKEFIVGQPSEPEDPNAKDSMDGMNMEETHDANSSH